MDWLSLCAVAVALAMDAFAVALVAGFTLNPPKKSQVFRFAFHFGLFQAMMPIIGWAAGVAVYRWIAPFDHWVAFGLLAFIGGKMIVGAYRTEKEEKGNDDPTKGWNLVILSVATSIDALAVGLSLAMLGGTIIVPAIVIGIVAALFTTTGMLLGGKIGSFWGKRVEVIGGLVLIGIGIKIVAEHICS